MHSVNLLWSRGVQIRMVGGREKNLLRELFFSFLSYFSLLGFLFCCCCFLLAGHTQRSKFVLKRNEKKQKKKKKPTSCLVNRGEWGWLGLVPRGVEIPLCVPYLGGLRSARELCYHCPLEPPSPTPAPSHPRSWDPHPYQVPGLPFCGPPVLGLLFLRLAPVTMDQIVGLPRPTPSFQPRAQVSATGPFICPVWPWPRGPIVQAWFRATYL